MAHCFRSGCCPIAQSPCYISSRARNKAHCKGLRSGTARLLISIQTLEELMGSQSLASAIKQPFYFQHLDIVCIGLLCLWALSPIASQALLRISYLDIDGTAITDQIQYVNTTARPVGLKGPAYIATVDALFLSALLAPRKIQDSSTDIWGNVKIPLVQLSNSTQ